MSVLADVLSVLVRLETLESKYPGGLTALSRNLPNATLCCDGRIVRVGFMMSEDALAFVAHLQHAGLKFFDEQGYVDIAMTHQEKGLLRPCDWLEFEATPRYSFCWLRGQMPGELNVPEWWEPGQISSLLDVRTLSFLRHENGLDVYLDLKGREQFVARTHGWQPRPVGRLQAAGLWARRTVDRLREFAKRTF